MTGAASKAVASCFALAAFAVAVLAGLAGGNEAVPILTRALIAMAVCYPVGLIVGLVCQHVIEQHIRGGGGDGGSAGAEQSDQNAEEAEDVIVV